MESLRNLCEWTPELVDEVNKRFLQDEISEERVFELMEWASFVFMNFNYQESRRPIEMPLPKKIFQFCEAFFFIFSLASRSVKIPYKYWEDIAPHLLNELRRFYLSSDEWEHFWFEKLDTKPKEDKKEELRTNPETAEIFNLWERDNIFSY